MLSAWIPSSRVPDGGSVATATAVDPDRLMIGLARLLAVVTLALTDVLLGCLPFDLSHRRQAGRLRRRT